MAPNTKFTPTPMIDQARIAIEAGGEWYVTDKKGESTKGGALRLQKSDAGEDILSFEKLGGALFPKGRGPRVFIKVSQVAQITKAA